MRLSQVNIAVRDMDAAVAFYERLGLQLRVTPDGRHASAESGGGLLLELDTLDFVPQWDSGWSGETGGSGVVVGFEVASREAVDELYSSLTAAGYRGHQTPYDAFWGARYAMVDDPDGYAVGLMSPVERERD